MHMHTVHIHANRALKIKSNIRKKFVKLWSNQFICQNLNLKPNEKGISFAFRVLLIWGLVSIELCFRMCVRFNVCYRLLSLYISKSAQVNNLCDFISLICFFFSNFLFFSFACIFFVIITNFNPYCSPSSLQLSVKK